MAIVAELGTGSTTSEAQRGGVDIVNGVGAVQVVRRGVTTGNFNVVLEAGYNNAGTIRWGEVATITQSDVDNPIAVTIAPSFMYRFRHASGVNVTAILA